MAGTNPDFDAAAFRDGIRFVYDMAAPPLEDEQLKFYFPSQLVYNKPVDDEDVPFDPSATVQRVQPAPVTVPCGVEYFDRAGEPVVFGTITASRIAVTLLDEDYKQVKGTTYVVLGGEKYNYQHTEAPSGLFDVGLYTLHFVAENDL